MDWTPPMRVHASEKALHKSPQAGAGISTASLQGQGIVPYIQDADAAPALTRPCWHAGGGSQLMACLHGSHKNGQAAGGNAVHGTASAAAAAASLTDSLWAAVDGGRLVLPKRSTVPQRQATHPVIESAEAPVIMSLVLPAL